MDEFISKDNVPMNMIDEVILDFHKERVIVLNNLILDDILENVILSILKWNKEDKNIPVEHRKPIWLYLQSPGGSSVIGFNLIDTITASETPVNTLCFAQCASMGFLIFLAGHKRYAFPNSVLMMHEGQITVINNASKAKDFMEFNDLSEERCKNFVLSHSKITSDFYDEIYKKEFYMYANEKGKELGCVDYIIGEDVELNKIF